MQQFACLVLVLFAQTYAFPYGLGQDSVERELVDGWNEGIYIPNPTEGVGAAGTVFGWNVYFQADRADNTFLACIFRQKSGTTYTLVGFNDLGGFPQGQNSIDLAEEEQFEVESGDVVGFYFSGGSSLPFDTYSCGHKLLAVSGTHNLVVGNDYTFPQENSLPCRHYSLNAQIGVGNDAVEREIMDGWTRGVYLPDSTQAIGGSGTVTGWSVYIQEERADSDLVAAVFRPVGGNRYSVVGATEIPTLPLGQRDIQLVPDQFIQVQSGDVIGFAFQGGSIIPFDTYSCSHKLLSFNNFPTLSPGAEFDFPVINSLPCRLYSIAAIFG